jgi:ketosteroid isomerase-like protein
MKKTLFGFVLLVSCVQPETDHSKQSVKEIIETDLAMSDMAMKEGFFKTLLLYADDSVIKPTEGEFPVIGKKNLENHWKGKKDLMGLSWEPIRAEASKSGDMGYTFGNWKLDDCGTVCGGNYYSIWKKQKDGKWKFVVDGGNNTPTPE